MNQNTYVCTNCGAEHPIDELFTVGDDLLCEDCADRFTLVCDECGTRIYEDDAITDDNHILCQGCFDNHYERCYHCDRIVHHYHAYYDDCSNAYCATVGTSKSTSSMNTATSLT